MRPSCKSFTGRKTSKLGLTRSDRSVIASTSSRCWPSHEASYPPRQALCDCGTVGGQLLVRTVAHGQSHRRSSAGRGALARQSEFYTFRKIDSYRNTVGSGGRRARRPCYPTALPRRDATVLRVSGERLRVSQPCVRVAAALVPCDLRGRADARRRGYLLRRCAVPR